MMSNPKSAQKWAEDCQQHHPYAVSVDTPTGGHASVVPFPNYLCVDCARTYARQVGETDRAQTVEFLEVEAKHKDWKPVLSMFRRLITAVRSLPVETP